MEQLECPVLVLWGEEDVMTPFDNPLSNFLKTWPKATYIPLTGMHLCASMYHFSQSIVLPADTGHALHDDRPDLVNGHLLPWLEETYGLSQQTL